MTKTTERKKFTDLVDALLRVPHSEIKEKLEAEKKDKKQKANKKVKHDN